MNEVDQTAVAAAWATRAADLARWTLMRLVNRIDVWGSYRSLNERGKAYIKADGTQARLGNVTTLPMPRYRGKICLTPEVLVRHFRATAPEQLVGLHSTSPENTSRWGALDIDFHGPTSSPPELNLTAALAWYAKLVALGFSPLLTDSNDKGGYHLLAIFSEPVATASVFAFLRWLVGDYGDYDLPAPPESFPKQARIESGRFGNWLRLPGRHHTRDHWSRMWNGQRWLEGTDAIDFTLHLRGDPPSRIPADALRSEPPSPLTTSTERLSGLGNSGAGGKLARRISAYVARLPNLAEGQGRDDVAFHLAAFLVRDLELSDDQALSWLSQWDSRNDPPKGDERLREVIANVHRYGRNAYGSGFYSCPDRKKLRIPQWKRTSKESSIRLSFEL